jgi:outer membrane murein-binding lipoprotein Lpp
MKSHLILLAVIPIALLLGCENSSRQPLWSQIQQLGREKTDLKLQVKQLQKKNEQLQSQVATLSSLEREVRLEALSGLERIEISKRSGLYDKDDDGKKESLIVYVQPFDDTGDTIKIVGKVIVQLWDLNRESNEAQIAQWQIEPTQLKRLWAGTFMTNYYRLKFDVANMLTGGEKELTVKVSFTDYLTGRTLRTQRAVNTDAS